MQTKEFRKAVNGAAGIAGMPIDAVTVIQNLQAKLVEVSDKSIELGLSGDEIRNVRNRMIAAAERTWMAARYPVLSLDFAEQQQRVLLERSAEGIKFVRRADEHTVPAKNRAAVSLPIFVCSWLDYDTLRRYFSDAKDSFSGYRTRYDQRCGQFPPYRADGLSFPRVDVQATAELPSGVTPPMFARIRRALAYLRLFAVLLFDHDVDDDGSYSEKVGVLWAPTDEAWSFNAQALRPKGDPAILIQSKEAVYLIGYYDTPDEKPITNLIREFTEGPLANI